MTIGGTLLSLELCSGLMGTSVAELVVVGLTIELVVVTVVLGTDSDDWTLGMGLPGVELGIMRLGGNTWPVGLLSGISPWVPACNHWIMCGGKSLKCAILVTC